MTTVADLITFLNKLPPDARVRVVRERHNYETWTEWVDLQLPTGDSALNDTETCYFCGDRLDLGDA